MPFCKHEGKLVLRPSGKLLDLPPEPRDTKASGGEAIRAGQVGVVSMVTEYARGVRNARKEGRCESFSLLEAAVGGAILLFGLASVLAVATQGYRYIADMRRESRSSQVLQQKLEDIRLITVWSNIWALNNTTFVDTNLPGTRFNGTITVTPYAPYDSYDGGAVVARVTVLVTWSPRSGRIRTNYLSTLVCKDGLNSYIF